VVKYPAFDSGQTMKRSDLQKWAGVANRSRTIKLDSDVKKAAPIRVRDLPGVSELEDRLLLYGTDPGRREDISVWVSRDLFGIGKFETRFQYHRSVDEITDPFEYQAVEQLRVAHESNFETGDHLTDDEIMSVMVELGLDFSDDRGQPLRCTKELCRPAEAALKGIMGARMQDLAEVKLENWGDNLEREAQAFLAKKRRR
jgi:hypothetical protein